MSLSVPASAIYQIDDDSPNVPEAADGQVGFNLTGPTIQRLAILFDISNAGEIIEAVSFSFSVKTGIAGSPVFEVFRVVRDILAAQLTWNEWKSGSAWATAGAGDGTLDYDGTFTFTYAAPAASARIVVPTSTGLTAMVQAGKDVSDTFWLLIKSQAEATATDKHTIHLVGESGSLGDPRLMIASSQDESRASQSRGPQNRSGRSRASIR